MREESISSLELKNRTTLDLKTITKLRKNRDIEKMQIGTFIKIKQAFPEVNILEHFPVLKEIIENNHTLNG